MPNEPETLKTPELDESKIQETPEDKKMNRIANRSRSEGRKEGKSFRPEPRYVSEGRTFWNGVVQLLASGSSRSRRQSPLRDSWTGQNLPGQKSTRGSNDR